MTGKSSLTEAASGLGRAGTALVIGLLALVAPPATAAFAAAPALKVEQVVILMRHGVRPPTKDPAMPAGIAAAPWPKWSVPPGWLTAHGAEAVKRLGKADRAVLAGERLIARSGCEDLNTIALISDSDQRTIATGDAWAAGFAPGCALQNHHKEQGAAEPLFSALQNDGTFDADAAGKAVRSELGAGGVAELEQRHQAALATLDRILCDGARPDCGVRRTPSQLAAPKAGKKPKLDGALDLGSTAAQILLLEYAEGKPMADVGWGRATAADIALLGSLHSSEFAITARTRYIAEHSFRPLIANMRTALAGRGPRIAVYMGHDTTVASLGGLLGLHWHIPGFAPDDPAPGGALIFEKVRDGAGNRFVRAFYRSQTLEQIRNLSADAPVRQALTFQACGTKPTQLCSEADFDAALGRLP